MRASSQRLSSAALSVSCRFDVAKYDSRTASELTEQGGMIVGTKNRNRESQLPRVVASRVAFHRSLFQNGLMPTFSDGQDALSPTMSDFFSTGMPSIGDMRAHLQLLLDNKERQLQQVGTLGQRILSQQVQLDERVRLLHDLEAELGDNQDLDSELRERYRELTEMVKSWDVDNTQLTESFGPKVCPFSRHCFDP